MNIVVIAMGAIWLVSVIVALFVTGKRARVALAATSVAFAAAWLFTIFTASDAAAKTHATAASTIASCATVDTGDDEESVRSHMGVPSEKRGEEELRGPGATVWIYRDSRCAVHFLDGVVESVD